MPIRTAFVACAAALAATLTMTACSSSGGATKGKDTPTPTSTAPTTSSAPAGPTPADAATTAAVTKAYTTFFGGTKDPAVLAADLQNGAKLAGPLATEAKNPTAATLTAKVTKVTLENPHVANVTFTPLSSGSVLLADQPGKAVLVNGTWTLAAATFCGLVLASGATPPECSDQSIIGTPSS